MPTSLPAAVDRELIERGNSHERAAGWLLVGAGVMFLVTVGYLFTVLPATGWSIAMFDAPADLLVWIARHERVYQVLWVLYFASQMCLLAVPVLLAGPGGRVAAVFGTAAVVLAMAGLALLFAVSPVLAQAYHQATGPGPDISTANVLVMHDLTADVGKDLRLFSELLLGVWLTITGRGLQRRSGQRRWWAFSVLGCWTLFVAAAKLFNPTIGLEDWLGFLLELGYLALGVSLLRTPSSEHLSRAQLPSGQADRGAPG